jgi:hypothetical protein
MAKLFPKFNTTVGLDGDNQKRIRVTQVELTSSSDHVHVDSGEVLDGGLTTTTSLGSTSLNFYISTAASNSRREIVNIDGGSGGETVVVTTTHRGSPSE